MAEKRILPRATKSSMVKLIRSKGYDVPSIYQAIFSRTGRAFWLRWVDKNKAPRRIHEKAYVLFRKQGSDIKK